MQIKAGDIFKSLLDGAEYIVKKIVNKMAVVESKNGKSQILTISPRAIAIGDFLNVPFFRPLNLENYLGQVGDPIKIHCRDDIGLVSVEVSIDKQDGTDAEMGMAVALDAREGFWIYTATKPVPLGTDVFIEVVGLDHAGHRIKMTENPTVGQD